MSNPNPPVNKFQVGNQLYKLASYTGRPKLFATPDDLWAAACGYFDWCVDNPVMVQKLCGAKIISIPKMRGMSLQGLSVHIGVCNLRHYKKKAEFSHVVACIYNVIFTHNFIGAVTGQLNPNLIARTLGIQDSVANESGANVIVYYAAK